MLSGSEIKEIFNTNIGIGVLEGCEYLKDAGLYVLDIDFDPEITDPHKKRSSFFMHCIKEFDRETCMLGLDEYLDYTGEIIKLELV